MTPTTNKGIVAGLAMSVVLFIFVSLGFRGGEGASYIKYLPLAVVLGAYFNSLSQRDARFYKHALGDGLKISAIAGAIIAVLNTTSFLINPSFSFSKYNLEPTKLSGALAVSGTIFFEVIVLGMLLTFIFFQMFKNRQTKRT